MSVFPCLLAWQVIFIIFMVFKLFPALGKKKLLALNVLFYCTVLHLALSDRCDMPLTGLHANPC